MAKKPLIQASGKLQEITNAEALDVPGALQQSGIVAPSFAPAGTGVIYFDSTSNTFKVSENGGAYTNLVGGGGGGMAIGGSITGATQGSVLFAGASGVLAQDNANLFWDATNYRLGVGTAPPSHVVDVQAGSVASGVYALNVDATLASGGGDRVSFIEGNVDSGVPPGTPVYGLVTGLNGAGIPAISYAGYFNTVLAGNGADPVSALQANFALRGSAFGTTALGHNVGVTGLAANGARNYGLFGNTTNDSTGANVAVTGMAKNNGGGVRIGGLFASQTTGASQPTVNTSAVLIADNMDLGDPIFLARDAGTTTFTIADSGYVTSQNRLDSTTAFQIKNLAGTTVLDVDTTHQRVGIGTTTPNARLTIDGGTSTAEELLLAKTSANGNAVVTVRNDTSGSAAQASLYLQTDPGAGRYSSFAVTSNGWTPNGLSLPNQYQSHPDTGLTNGMLFATEAANAPIVFAVPTVNGNGFATTSERLRVNGAEVVVNDAAQNVDFRVEGTTDANALVVDASANAVGIGTATPSQKLEVAGNIRAASSTNTEINSVTTDTSSYGQIAGVAPGNVFWTMRANGSGVAATFMGTPDGNWNTWQAGAGGNGLKVGVNASGQQFLLGSYEPGTITSAVRLTLNDDEAIFNAPGHDFDFRVESVANANMLFVDASANAVGIGNPTPATALDVVGVIKASTGVVAPLQTNAQTASLTLALSDASKVVEVDVTSPSTATVTVPANGTVAFPIGTQILVLQTGTGMVSIAADVGVTIDYRSGLGLNLNGQWAVATLVKRATDTWVLFGDLA